MINSFKIVTISIVLISLSCVTEPKNSGVNFINNEYFTKLDSAEVSSVSFGYSGIMLFSKDQFNNAQKGFRVDFNGTSLVSAKAGSWKEQWYVIGFEESCGDPIFIDINKKGYPVYTAMLGIGKWDPMIVSESLDLFLYALEEVDLISRNRSNPIELEDNPLTDEEAQLLLSNICKGEKGLEFWEVFLESDY